jgi:hypothetical protein
MYWTRRLLCVFMEKLLPMLGVRLFTDRSYGLCASASVIVSLTTLYMAPVSLTLTFVAGCRFAGLWEKVNRIPDRRGHWIVF